MKRLYRSAAVIDHADGYGVALDDKPVNTPVGGVLVVPTRALAAAIVAEWAAQGDTVMPHTMPLMQLMATALDRVAPARTAAIDELLRYGGTDLLCYRADAPPDLVERQAAIWQPLVDWAELRYGAPLAVTQGLMPRPQPAAALAALRVALEPLDAPSLTGLLAATGAAGSLILALALRERRLSAEEAWALSLLDETFQIERWGEDAAAAQRRTALRADLIAAARFLELAAV
ncbi:MAG: ATPase [Proteobacteria bacterium]|nr:ATPase [Pseudomonadota bacterium]